MVSPRVTVVVATHDRAALLPRLHAALAGQRDAPTFRVVVVDDASTDATPTVLAELAERPDLAWEVVRLSRNGGPARARNAGLAQADTPWVAFTDDDCVPTPSWLAALVAAGEREHAGVVGGRVAPAPDQARGPFSRTLQVDDARYLQTANVLYRREALVGVGGFDDRLRTGEDTDLAQRVLATGARLAFADDALVHHDVSPSSVRGAVANAARWVDLPAVVRRHPTLRDTHATHRIFWKDTHPPLWAGLLGTAGALGGRRAWPLLAWGWWVWHRLARVPVGASPRERVRGLPGALAVDVTEALTMVRGSVRHRSLLL